MIKDKIKDSATAITPPIVTMVMGQQCSYCGPMMLLLVELMKAGKIAQLKIIDIEQNLEMVQQWGVRSVPWLKINAFELTGSRHKDEIEQWLERASSFEGMNQYLGAQLSEGNIKIVTKLIEKQPKIMANVLSLLDDGDEKINIRLGVGVIIETYAEQELFKPYVTQLQAYLKHEDARVRGDACHYLSLTKDMSQLSLLAPLLQDKSAEVREIAQESVASLKES